MNTSVQTRPDDLHCQGAATESPRKAPGPDPTASAKQGRTRITGRRLTGRVALDGGRSHGRANLPRDTQVIESFVY